MPQKTHPESLNEVQQIEITPAIREFITETSHKVDYHRVQRSEWEDRVDRWTQLRFGIRSKKTFPWPGAANFVIPLIDADIGRLKPAYVQLGFGVSPIVTYEPFGAEDIEPARKREQVMEWRLRNKMNFFTPYVVGVDKMLEKGFVVFKIHWRYETNTYTEYFDLDEIDSEIVKAMYETTDEMLFEMIREELQPDMELEENIIAIGKAIKEFRAGKKKIEIEFSEREHDEPEMIVCDPKEDIVVPIETQNINDALFIDYKYWVSKNKLKRDMESGVFEEYSDHQIEGWSRRGKTLARYWKAKRDGVMSLGNDDMILLHETCVWYDYNGDGIEERCIVTWPDADTASPLRFIGLPYEHGRWPYVQVKRELIDDWFYASRGISALDEDFQVGISTKFNQDIDTQTIINTPTWISRKNAIKNIKNLRYIPGQWLEVDDPNNDAKLMPGGPNANQSTFLTTANYLKAWANERIGNLYAGLSNSNNPAGSGEGGKKTAREIEAISFVSSQTTSLDLMVFQEQMKEVYFQIDALYEQFGPDEEEIMTGDQAIKISRREMQGKFNIAPTGKYDNSQPQARLQKDMMLVRMFSQDPDVRQYELKKAVMDDIDIRLSKKLLLTNEESQQRSMVIQQQAQQQKNQTVTEQVQMKRIANALDIEKEAALAAIQGRQFAPD